MWRAIAFLASTSHAQDPLRESGVQWRRLAWHWRCDHSQRYAPCLPRPRMEPRNEHRSGTWISEIRARIFFLSNIILLLFNELRGFFNALSSKRLLADTTPLFTWKSTGTLEIGPHDPKGIDETYKGMFSHDWPCSGFVTKDPDDNNKVCAGFRQCS